MHIKIKRTKMKRYFITKRPQYGIFTVKSYILKNVENCDDVRLFYNKMIKKGHLKDIVKDPIQIYLGKGGFGGLIPEDGYYYLIEFIDYTNPKYVSNYTMTLYN